MERGKPLISILCAVYNDARFIKETLDSVVAQTYPNLELIVMDGASNDGTLEILNEYADKYDNIVVHSEPDSGQWHALEKALSIAKGEYITLLCGQDGYVDEDWFRRCIETFEKHPEISLAWGIPINMSEDSKLLGPHYAYAKFLKDNRYGLQTRPITTITTRIDTKNPHFGRLILGILRKLTPNRLITVLRSFHKQDIPLKEDWFFYWLKTGLTYPEGNMCVRKNVFIENTIRFPKEKRANFVFQNFYFDFNAKGYLSYGLPVAASFGRYHAEGQDLREYDTELMKTFRDKLEDFRIEVKNRKSFKFVGPDGSSLSERPVNL